MSDTRDRSDIEANCPSDDSNYMRKIVYNESRLKLHEKDF